MLASLPRSAWWLMAAVALVAWFAPLDFRHLQHPDEGRYAEIAREMVVTGDWLTPRSNGYKSRCKRWYAFTPAPLRLLLRWRRLDDARRGVLPQNIRSCSWR